MTALSTLVPALKRELAVPGTFETLFPNTSDDDLTGSLADGFGEARLQGFFPDIALSSEGEGWETDPELSLSGSTLVVIFTSMRFIRAQIRNLNSVERYKAGPAEFETQRAATTLKAELDFLQKRMDTLIANAKATARASVGLATVYDNYLARGGDVLAAGGLYSHEFRTG